MVRVPDASHQTKKAHCATAGLSNSRSLSDLIAPPLYSLNLFILTASTYVDQAVGEPQFYRLAFNSYLEFIKEWEMTVPGMMIHGCLRSSLIGVEVNDGENPWSRETRKGHCIEITVAPLIHGRTTRRPSVRVERDECRGRLLDGGHRFAGQPPARGACARWPTFAFLVASVRQMDARLGRRARPGIGTRARGRNRSWPVRSFALEAHETSAGPA